MNNLFVINSSDRYIYLSKRPVIHIILIKNNTDFFNPITKELIVMEFCY
jgi:hypothetical protein